MTKDNSEFPHAFSVNDFQKFFELSGGAKAPNWAALMDMNRKNAQTLAQIQQMGLETWQDMFGYTQRITQDLLNEQSGVFSSFIQEGTPEDKLSDASDALQAVYQKAHQQYRDMADKQHQLSQNMSDILSRRIKANMKELKETFGGE